jgi:DNA repair protein RecO
MSHHIHHTRGIILNIKKIKEADCLVFILTQDLGKIHAHAQGIRRMESKLRYSLSQFDLVDISCVKGKNGWRIVNAQVLKQYSHILNKNIKTKCAQIAYFIDKFFVSDEDAIFSFKIFENTLEFLHSTSLNSKQIDLIELISVFRLMHSLGYVSLIEKYKTILSTLDFSDLILKEAEENKKELISLINKGIRESGI